MINGAAQSAGEPEKDLKLADLSKPGKSRSWSFKRIGAIYASACITCDKGSGICLLLVQPRKNSRRSGRDPRGQDVPHQKVIAMLAIVRTGWIERIPEEIRPQGDHEEIPGQHGSAGTPCANRGTGLRVPTTSHAVGL